MYSFPKVEILHLILELTDLGVAEIPANMDVVYVQITLEWGKEIKATTLLDSGTSVYAKMEYLDLTYTTEKVTDMGGNPVWKETNKFDFVFKPQEKDFITLKLYNKNDTCIGLAKVSYEDIMRLGNGPTPLNVPVFAKKMYEKKCGEVGLKIQRKQQETAGELGLVRIKLVGGHVEKMTSFLEKTAEVHVKLLYEHLQYKSEVLKKSGGKFVWSQDSNRKVYAFAINNKEAKLTLQVYNYEKLVGKCDIKGSDIIERSMKKVDFRVNHDKFVQLEPEDLKNDKGNVGTITFEVNLRHPLIDRRQSFPQFRDLPDPSIKLHKYHSIITTPPPDWVHVQPHSEDVQVRHQAKHHLRQFFRHPSIPEGSDQVPVLETEQHRGNTGNTQVDHQANHHPLQFQGRQWPFEIWLPPNSSNNRLPPNCGKALDPSAPPFPVCDQLPVSELQQHSEGVQFHFQDCNHIPQVPLHPLLPLGPLFLPESRFPSNPPTNKLPHNLGKAPAPFSAPSSGSGKLPAPKQQPDQATRSLQSPIPFPPQSAPSHPGSEQCPAPELSQLEIKKHFFGTYF